MALSEIAEFIGASAGILIVAGGIAVIVVGFLAMTRLGARVRPSPGKK